MRDEFALVCAAAWVVCFSTLNEKKKMQGVGGVSYETVHITIVENARFAAIFARFT